MLLDLLAQRVVLLVGGVYLHTQLAQVLQGRLVLLQGVHARLVERALYLTVLPFQLPQEESFSIAKQHLVCLGQAQFVL